MLLQDKGFTLAPSKLEYGVNILQLHLLSVFLVDLVCLRTWKFEMENIEHPPTTGRINKDGSNKDSVSTLVALTCYMAPSMSIKEAY